MKSRELTPLFRSGRLPGAIYFPAFPAARTVRDTEGLPQTLGRLGSLEVRLATRKKEIRKAQKLRFRVFYTEGGAKSDPRGTLTRRDICRFDRVCDHLLVIDHAALNQFGLVKPKVVGVYRLLRQDRAGAIGGFYTATEFDIEPLLQRHATKRFLELGRSCVHPDWRSKRVLELLWRGIWTYVRHHRVDVLIGCASLPGADPIAHVKVLEFLDREASAHPDWRASARPERRAPSVPTETSLPDVTPVRNLLPPLIKGYLRVGAKFGDGAVVDHQFGTTDVLVIMPVAEIDPRYQTYFTEAAPMGDAIS
jgi:putative hemolysin